MNSGDTREQDVVRLIVQRVPRVFPVRRIVLFGSRAENVHRPDSDYDILVVAESSLSPAARAALVRKALIDVREPLDILVVTPEEYARLSAWKSSVVYSANERGRVLYEAA